MKNVWILSDHHFGHVNALNFRDALTGEKMRHWEPHQIEEMNEHMVECWNSVVQPNDTCYHLGDCFFGKENHKFLGRLNGTKELIMGNHDEKDLGIYLKHFKRVHGSMTIRSKNRSHDLLLTHFPIHPDQFYRFYGNIHGHIHRSVVKLPDGRPDPRYLNVSVEMIDYTPISLDVALQRIKTARESMQFTQPSLGQG